MSSTRSRPKGVLFIAIYKILEGLLLLAAAFGVLKLLHQDVAAVVYHWVNVVRIDPGNFFIHGFLERLADVDDRKLKALSVGTFIYSALALAQGVGLALAKRWAEYFTVIITVSFIPLELLEIYRRATPLKVVLLFVNLIVVAYLLIELRRSNPSRLR
jgi:uncharacterized membrane protein (DUF2068 family)